MLKLPKGLKKKKKGKKSKRKGEEELFTEEELEQYRRQQQQQQGAGAAGGAPAGEQWAQFQDLTTGVDCVLRRTQGDLDRIKSTSFFQRAPPAPAPAPPPPRPARALVEVTEADFPRAAATAAAAAAPADPSSGDDSSDSGDSLFDTSYVDAVERGEVRLACVPDSPDAGADDRLFDTSHVTALIQGEARSARAPRPALDVALAVGVLTGRIDNVQVAPTRRKRPVPGDLLLDAAAPAPCAVAPPPAPSLLDADEDLVAATPIDLGASLPVPPPPPPPAPEEPDEFSLLAVQSLEAGAQGECIKAPPPAAEPVPQAAWSAFEADRLPGAFAAGIVEDALDPDADELYAQGDPFDTSFAEGPARLDNRRRSSVRIHLTSPAGQRESLSEAPAPVPASRDLLAGSCSDLSRLEDSPLSPASVIDDDPFDTSRVAGVVAPGRVELQLLERELIAPAPAPAPAPLSRVPSDPDFDPRAEEPAPPPRRASRPENLVVTRSVAFSAAAASPAPRAANPATPYYARALAPALTAEPAAAPAAAPAHDPFDTSFAAHTAPSRTELRLLAAEFSCEEPEPASPDLLAADELVAARALSPLPPPPRDPFDTSFLAALAPGPGRTELRLLESEFLH